MYVFDLSTILLICSKIICLGAWDLIFFKSLRSYNLMANIIFNFSECWKNVKRSGTPSFFFFFFSIFKPQFFLLPSFLFNRLILVIFKDFLSVWVRMKFEMLNYREQSNRLKLLWLFHVSIFHMEKQILVRFLYLPQSEKLNYIHADNNLN